MSYNDQRISKSNRCSTCEEELYTIISKLKQGISLYKAILDATEENVFLENKDLFENLLENCRKCGLLHIIAAILSNYFWKNPKRILTISEELLFLNKKFKELHYREHKLQTTLFAKLLIITGSLSSSMGLLSSLFTRGYLLTSNTVNLKEILLVSPMNEGLMILSTLIFVISTVAIISTFLVKNKNKIFVLIAEAILIFILTMYVLNNFLAF